MRLWTKAITLLWTASSLAMSPELFLNSTTTNGAASLDADRSCTVNELLPNAVTEGKLSSSWVFTDVRKPLYGCDCSFFKARYYCPSLAGHGRGYPTWVPRNVADGFCKVISLSELRQAPLPSGFKVLLYGNSHMRQVVEATMCIFSGSVLSKRVTYEREGSLLDERVTGETACRSCKTFSGDDLVNNGCLHGEENAVKEACECDDDHAEYFFENGAIVHYYFAHYDNNKSVTDALRHHGNGSLSNYDAVFANVGNHPQLTANSVCDVAFELQATAVPFFFLSEYNGIGDIGDWDVSQRTKFFESGAKYVNVSDMALGLDEFSKGAVEGHRNDAHFCLPGPPDEIGLLMLNLMWAVHRDRVA